MLIAESDALIFESAINNQQSTISPLLEHGGE
jgi:hypothetical protein